MISGEYDPLAPAPSTAVGSVVGPLLDFAVVSVQMRGTGCSGGAFDLFGLPSTFDGYDMIETVGNQPWVKGGKVGMGGISFSGITQLFTAGTQPPHLAAISPMSVTDDRYLASVYPGGIFNEGFALEWLTARMEDARPAPEGGQDWAKALTQAGDEHCIDNQRMRLQSTDAVQRTRGRPYRSDERFDERAPASWIDKIEVPVFWVGQFQDEQTGGHFVESLSKLDDNEDVWITLQNGVHADSLGPSSIVRWIEFMNLFVADRIPVVPPTVLSSSGALYRALADAPALPVSQSRFAGYTDVDQARAEFMEDPRVRILMDNGAALDGSPGAIGAGLGDELRLLADQTGEADAATTSDRGAASSMASRRGRAGRTTSPTRAPGRPRPSTATTRPTRGGRSRHTTGLRSRSAGDSASRAPFCAGTPWSPGRRASTST